MAAGRPRSALARPQGPRRFSAAQFDLPRAPRRPIRPGEPGAAVRVPPRDPHSPQPRGRLRAGAEIGTPDAHRPRPAARRAALFRPCPRLLAPRPRRRKTPMRARASGPCLPAHSGWLGVPPTRFSIFAFDYLEANFRGMHILKRQFRDLLCEVSCLHTYSRSR